MIIQAKMSELFDDLQYSPDDVISLIGFPFKYEDDFIGKVIGFDFENDLLFCELFEGFELRPNAKWFKKV